MLVDCSVMVLGRERVVELELRRVGVCDCCE